MAKFHQFSGVILHDTNRAVLFLNHYRDEPEFFPKSQIEIRRDPDSTFEVTVLATDWIARQKGISEDTFQ